MLSGGLLIFFHAWTNSTRQIQRVVLWWAAVCRRDVKRTLAVTKSIHSVLEAIDFLDEIAHLLSRSILNDFNVDEYGVGNIRCIPVGTQGYRYPEAILCEVGPGSPAKSLALCGKLLDVCDQTVGKMLSGRDRVRHHRDRLHPLE